MVRPERIDAARRRLADGRPPSARDVADAMVRHLVAV
jgi:hypothetical protein